MQKALVTTVVAGLVGGCPGTVDVTRSDGAPPTVGEPGEATGAPIDDAARSARGPWVTVAATFLLIEGGLGFVYAPTLFDGDPIDFNSVLVLAVGFAAVNVAAGLGLLLLRGWAQLAAGAVSLGTLVFMHAPALMVALKNDAWVGFDWLGLAGSLVVLFAVVRRWPEREAGSIAG